MGGGPSGEQKRAAASQEALSRETLSLGRERNARENEQYAAIKPFALSRLEGGLPFRDILLDAAGGVNARAFAPAYARVNRAFATDGLPSGSRESAMRAVDTERARAFDDSLIGILNADENTKAEAARLLTGQQQIANPAQFYQLSQQGNNSVMQAPLQRPGIGGILGGIAGSVISKIPF